MSCFFVFYINNNISNRTGELCHDGVKNQGEEEIDCGGPCDPCGKLETKVFHRF